MTDLSGKTALVTGSAQGIGHAVALSLASAGARIALHGLPGEPKAEAALAAMHAAGAPEARFFGADMADPEAIGALMHDVAQWGGVDILVNSAGIQFTAPLQEMPPEKWQAIIAINLSAAFYTMRVAMPEMARRGYGRVINIASVHGLVASREKAPYVAAKFGLVGLTKVAALEYANAGSRASGGVTANCIAPGWVETDLIAPQIDARAAAHGGNREAGAAALLAEKQPSQRLSEPGEIGALALWLAAPIAHNITGTTIPVDGGWTAQ